MSRPNFLPSNDAELDIWLKSFSGKLTQFSTLLAISPAEVTALQADSVMLTYALAQISWFENELAKRYEYKRTFLDAEIGATIGAYPVLTAPAVAPAAVPAGLMRKISNLVKRIKGMPSYTENIGKDLDIITPKSTKSLKSIDKPSFTLSIEGGHPALKWIKRSVEGINIFVDRNDDKGFVMVCGCTRSKFIDLHELPSVVTNWTYKIIFTKGTSQIGIFSDAAAIAVINDLASVNTSGK